MEFALSLACIQDSAVQIWHTTTPYYGSFALWSLGALVASPNCSRKLQLGGVVGSYKSTAQVKSVDTRLIREQHVVQWVGSSATHTGHVRSTNEDAVIERPEVGLWAIADGMGGHAAGDVASAWVVQALAQMDCPKFLPARVDAVEAVLESVNAKILAYADQKLGGRTMGTTVLTLLIEGNAGLCLWAGDSRLYRWRAGELKQISADHNYAHDLREQGWPEEAIANQPNNIITRAVGGALHLFLDATLFTVREGDRFLLCSDGLSDELDDKTLKRLMSNGCEVTAPEPPFAGSSMIFNQPSFQNNCSEREHTPSEITQSLLQSALAGRARDNVSLIVVQSSAA